ncbi:bifunctional bis(5'-adenosyl)-triphosphatase/adenylylsulfatase FHIT [Oryza sativa Japonica Group]|uniref:bifunctional bis(5'-adenosyl)-triphosphatase/adenylylsulfatase FHIT n=1 Tax=Oryza sativa subsp. japonica TaxID=39947 RepID=UPI000E1BEA6D|nr:bifunctional bis(5'-adenosyl)-triphosphatase/adenylylsulfatase FHIT isoform X3 [Oryza sativa Japonica Group]
MDPVAGSRYRFGPHEIAERQVFRTSPLSFAIVNLRPTRPGHILYFCQLCDIGVRVEQYQRASSLTFTIQDGPHSGQTVPHVHVHIVPRRKEDFENNDNNNGMYIVNIFRIFLRGTANLKHKYNANETRSAGLKKLSNT